MKIVLNRGQVDILSGFFSNMSVAWFIAAFIAPASFRSIFMFAGYGLFALYISLLLKGGE